MVRFYTKTFFVLSVSFLLMSFWSCQTEEDEKIFDSNSVISNEGIPIVAIEQLSDKETDFLKEFFLLPYGFHITAKPTPQEDMLVFLEIEMNVLAQQDRFEYYAVLIPKGQSTSGPIFGNGVAAAIPWKFVHSILLPDPLPWKPGEMITAPDEDAAPERGQSLFAKTIPAPHDYEVVSYAVGKQEVLVIGTAR